MRNKTHFPSCAKRIHETAIISENRPFRSLAARTRMSRGQRGQTLGPYKRHAVYYFPSRLGVLQRPHARRTCHHRDIPHSLNVNVPLMKEMVFLHVSLSSRVWDRLRSRDSKDGQGGHGSKSSDQTRPYNPTFYKRLGCLSRVEARAHCCRNDYFALTAPRPDLKTHNRVSGRLSWCTRPTH